MSWLGVPQETTPRPWPWRALTGVALTAFGMALCLTLLFFAMRGIMDLGGFVAKGGPYVIAHPSPEWVWLVPASISLGMILGFANTAFAHAADGFTLALPGWSAVFLSLGWNFAEYGVHPPGGGGLIWAWIVCAALFFVMGAAPVLLLFDHWTLVERVRQQMRPSHFGANPRGYRRAYLALNVGAVLIGGVLGTLAFSLLAG